MRLFVRRAMSGRPPLFVRLMVAAAGAVAVLFFAAAAYLYFAAPEGEAAAPGPPAPTGSAAAPLSLEACHPRGGATQPGGLSPARRRHSAWRPVTRAAVANQPPGLSPARGGRVICDI